MPNFKQHAFIESAVGIVFSLVGYHVKKQYDNEACLDFEKLLAHAATGCIAASLPDLIEPATNPNHRGFFHSIIAGIAVSWITYKAHDGRLDPRFKSLIGSMGLGYISHLLADGTTPQGLPIL